MANKGAIQAEQAEPQFRKKKKSGFPWLPVLAGLLAIALAVGGVLGWQAYSVWKDDQENGYAAIAYLWPEEKTLQEQFSYMATGESCFDKGYDAALALDGISPGESRTLRWTVASTGTRSLRLRQSLTVSAMANDGNTQLDANAFQLLDGSGKALTGLEKTENEDGSVTWTFVGTLLNGSKQVEKEIVQTEQELTVQLKLDESADADPTGRKNYYKCAVTVALEASCIQYRGTEEVTLAEWPAQQDYQTIDYHFTTLGLTADSLGETEELTVVTASVGKDSQDDDTLTYLELAEKALAEGAQYEVSMSLLGDSITRGHNSTKAYGDFLAQDYGFTIYNYGIDGSTVSTAECYFDATIETNPMVERAAGMKDADIIFVWGGTNDQSICNTPIGRLSSTDTDTFCGALNVLLTTLAEEYPNARAILVATPLQRQNMQAELTPYRNAVRNVVNNRVAQDPETFGNLYYVDMFNFPEVDFTLRIDKLMPDGLHPNVDGQKIIAKTLLGFMLSEGIVTEADNSNAAPAAQPAATGETAENAALAQSELPKNLVQAAAS